MKNPMKILAATVAAATLLFTGCGNGNELGKLNRQQAQEQVNSYVESGKVAYKPVEHGKDDSWAGDETTADDLPPIDKYPLSVDGRADIVVTIASSTEKATTSTKKTGWLDQMARKFNASGATVNGKRIAISVRPMASGLALDYITSRKYVPDAYSPANELWRPMIESSGMKVVELEKRLTGNAAGLLLRQDAYDNFTKKYGAVTVPNVVKAVLAGDLQLGHTDPNKSSTGLNFLVQELLALDSANPLSQQATETYRQFQANVPPASPTTAEMAVVAKKGLANAVIMEAQAKNDEPTLATGWVFTPAGVRHDSPLYALNGLSGDKLEALKLFGKFSLSADSQAAATQLGFNQYDNYKGTDIKLSATQLYGALKVWKQNKDGGVPVVSMIVFDRSGSMGDPITGATKLDETKMKKAKDAVRAASNYISPDNYVGLMSYGNEDDITLDLPIGQFNDLHHSKLIGAINELRSGGETATYSAIVAALHHMLQFNQAGQNVKFRIILISDGVMTRGFGINQAIQLIDREALNVPVYGIAYESGGDLESMQALANVGESAYVIKIDGANAASELIILARAEL